MNTLLTLAAALSIAIPYAPSDVPVQQNVRAVCPGAAACVTQDKTILHWYQLDEQIGWQKAKQK